jgi:hypothetical protein
MNPRLVAERQVRILWLAAVAVMASCGGRVDGSPREGTAADCGTFCARMLAPQCPNDDLGQCISDCSALPSQGCAGLHQNLLDCAVHKAKYLCGGDHAVMQGCDLELQGYLGCINVSGPDSGSKDAASGG